MKLRNPEVRKALLRDVAILYGALGETDHISLGDAVEEVSHLLDPTLGGEPGDVLLTDAEVASGTALWRALERAAWPVAYGIRTTDPAWVEVVRAATGFVRRAAQGER